LYKDIESNETVTREQLYSEYRTAVESGNIDEQEQSFSWYLTNCLTAYGGTLEELK